MSDQNAPHYRLYLTREELQFLFDLINAQGVAFPYKSAKIAVGIGADLEDALKADPGVIPARDIPLTAPGASQSEKIIAATAATADTYAATIEKKPPA